MSLIARPGGIPAGRFRRAAVAGLCAVLVVGSPAVAQPPPGLVDPVRPELVDPSLRAELAAASAGEQVTYLVALGDRLDLAAVMFDREKVVAALKETATRSQAPVLENLRSRPGQQILNTFWLANLVLVRSPVEDVTAVTALPGVARILPVTTLEVPDPEPEQVGAVTPDTVNDRTWGLDRIGAHRVWDELGLDGSGVRVAVLDTGVRHDHPDLAGKLVTEDPGDPTHPGGWMEWDQSGQPVRGVPRDTHGHGTHVSGTVVGGAASGIHIGGAPGARLMHGLVLPGGTGTTPQVIAGMQWALDPYDHTGQPAGEPAQVVNMSFGPLAGGINSQFLDPVRNLYAAGVLPVASAGNCGEGCHGSPGNVFEALAVGATDREDGVAGFSSGGLAEAADWADPPDGWPASWVVPDLAAPGVDVLSSVRASFGPPYGRSSGTSMAAPHVAAAAALMLSGDPSLTVDEILEALVETAFFDDRHGAARPNPRFGHGRIDAFQAAARVVLGSGIAGRALDAGTGEPVAGVRVDVIEAGVSLRTAGDGRFEFRLPPGSYTLELSWSGQVVAGVEGVVVTPDLVTGRDVALAGVGGVVRDGATGEPVPGVTVAAAGTGVQATTGGDGAYRLYLPPGTYTLLLSSFAYQQTSVAEVTVDPGGVGVVDVALPPLPTGTVTGVVRFAESGLGIPGVTVELVDGPRSATTTADGRYTIAGVPVGGHAVVARPELFLEPATVEVTVEPGTPVAVDFTLDCTAACAGLWVSRYSGPAGGLDAADSVALSRDGSRLFTTGSSTGVATDQDYATVAYDPLTGALLWSARYDGPPSSQDGANAVAVSPDGTRVYVTGLSLGRGVTSSGADYATVAYDAASGAQLWVARYDGPGQSFDNARAVAVTPDGTKVIVTGQSRAAGSPARSEYATVAYDAAGGAELWVSRYTGPGNDFDSASDLAVSPDGAQVFVTGQSPGEGGQSSQDGTGWDYATVAYGTGGGEQLWVARYDGTAGGLDQATAVAASPDGSHVVVTGRSTGAGTGLDYATVAYRPGDGGQLWAARYDGPAGQVDDPADLAFGPDSGSAYVTGLSRAGAGAGTADYATVAYDLAGGVQRWAARYAGPGAGADGARAVTVAPDGSRVVVTGGSEGAGTGADYATVAYHPNGGGELWVARYDGPAGDADRASAVVFSPDSSRLFVTGRSGLGAGGDPLVAPSHFATVAYPADGSGESPVLVAHDLRIDSPVGLAGTPLRVRAAVTNVGTAAGAYAATLLVDDTAEDSVTVTLKPGKSADLAWVITPDRTGLLSLRLGHAALDTQVRQRCVDAFPAGTAIAFGGQDSGVANRDRGDGCTFLDLVWADGFFGNHGDLVGTVEEVVTSWRRDGLLTTAEAQAVRVAAANSDLGRE